MYSSSVEEQVLVDRLLDHERLLKFQWVNDQQMTSTLEILSLRMQSQRTFAAELIFKITRWISLSSDSSFSHRYLDSVTSKISFENLDQWICQHHRVLDDLASCQDYLYTCRSPSQTVRNVSRLIFLKWWSQYRYCQRNNYCNSSNLSSYSSNSESGVIKSPSLYENRSHTRTPRENFLHLCRGSIFCPSDWSNIGLIYRVSLKLSFVQKIKNQLRWITYRILYYIFK